MPPHSGSPDWGINMRRLILCAAAFSLLGIAGGAQAQQSSKLFFEGDMVRGDQPGAPGPFCVLANQFKRLEKVVWRIRVLDGSGKSLDASGLKSLVVELPDGQKLEGRFAPHPPPRLGPAQDHFWTARWIIPENYPSGTFAYKVVAVDQEGKAHTWEPFMRTPSQLQVIAGAIEIKKPTP
jgi:hypothetical protein